MRRFGGDDSFDDIAAFLNAPAVRAALHVAARTPAWQPGSDEVGFLLERGEQGSVRQLFPPLLEHLHVLIYNGVFDMVRWVAWLGQPGCPLGQLHAWLAHAAAVHPAAGSSRPPNAPAPPTACPAPPANTAACSPVRLLTHPPAHPCARRPLRLPPPPLLLQDCNFMGTDAWLSKMEWPLAERWGALGRAPWMVPAADAPTVGTAGTAPRLLWRTIPPDRGRRRRSSRDPGRYPPRTARTPPARPGVRPARDYMPCT